MKKRFFIIIPVILIFLTDLYPEIFWDGRFYEQVLFSFREEGNKVHTSYLGISILDLRLDAVPTDILRVRGELEYSLAHQAQNPLLTFEEIAPVVVKNLNASITPGDFKFTIGRFLPAWGKGKIFRPLDIFIPQLYFLNMLSFTGIDGVSVKYYVSDLSSIEFIAIPSMDTRLIAPWIDISTNSPFLNEMYHPVAAVNAEIHIAAFDNNLIFLNDMSSGNNLLGLAFKGDIIVGLWSELFYSFNSKKKKDTFRASVGADYSFAKYYFITAEYFYDASGMPDYKKYPLLMALLPRMTFGKQYLMLDFNILTYTEMNYGITYLGNLLDESFVVFTYFRHEIIENCFLGLSLYHFNGKVGREFSSGLAGDFVFNTYLVVRF